MLFAISMPMRMPAGGFSSAVAAPAMVNGRFNMVGPFITLAHALPIELAPGALSIDDDVRPHPHIGLAALTYLLAGEIDHRDSLGNDLVIRSGDVGWMVAGSGVCHSERYRTLRAEGGQIESLQIWAALPDEECTPSFRYVASGAVATDESDGVIRRLLAGRGSAITTIGPAPWDFYLNDVALTAGATLNIGEDYRERAVYVVSGDVACDGAPLSPNQTAMLVPGSPASVTALSDARLISFGGEPVGERLLWWNFISADRSLIEAAKDKWRRGEFARPASDHDDFTPCPADDARPLLLVKPYSS